LKYLAKNTAIVISVKSIGLTIAATGSEFRTSTLRESASTIRFEFVMQPSAKTLRTAASIAEKIDALQNQLEHLLENGLKPQAEPVRKLSVAQKRSSSPPRKKASPGKGTLTPAVQQVLAETKGPVKAAAIYEALLAKGYKFTSPKPRKILGIRLYKMAGVQPVGNGLFRLKKH
jgi:hypothetical protein